MLGFGTTLWLRAAHHDIAQLDRALDAAVQQLLQIDGAMNLFDPDSQISRLNRDGLLRSPSPHLLAVLSASSQVAQRSGGLFDVTVQPLWRCWWEAAQAGRHPRADHLASAMRKVDWRAIDIDRHRIRFARVGMAITLNGIAQGYAAEQTARLLRRHGISQALLDTGEWASLGRNPAGDDWTLGLENPASGRPLLRLTLPVDHRVAMSSNALQLLGPDHHHVLDPRSGHSPHALAAVAVVASNAMLADALTKPMFMGDAGQAIRLASTWQVGVVTIDRLGQWTVSPNLSAHVRPV